jgi:hypothetical protein
MIWFSHAFLKLGYIQTVRKHKIGFPWYALKLTPVAKHYLTSEMSSTFSYSSKSPAEDKTPSPRFYAPV